MAKVKAPEEAGRVNELIGERIKKRREALNITQEEMCEALDIGIDGYKKNENGSNGIPLYRLLKIMDILECDLYYLRGAIEEPRKEVADIRKETGLSEKAISIIQHMPDSSVFDGLKRSESIRAKMREQSMEQHAPVYSWFIENGILECLKGMDTIKEYNSENEYKSFHVLPDLFKKMLDYHYSFAKGYMSLTDRKKAFLNKIALDLFMVSESELKEYITDFASLDNDSKGANTLRVCVDDKEYMCVSEATGIDYFDEVQRVIDADKESEFGSLIRNTSDQKKQYITFVTFDLFNRSFDYFETRDNTSISEVANRMNRFRDLMNQYLEK